MEFKYNIPINLNENSSHMQILKRIKRQSTVLEAGCATGYMTKIIKNDLHCNVTCLEVDPEAAEIAKAYCDQIIVGDIEGIDFSAHFSKEQFDTIIFADVLEHLRYPQNVLTSLLPYLKKDGNLLISIPNISHASVVLNLILGNFEYTRYGLLDETHLRFYTKENFTNLLNMAGYNVIEIDRVIFIPEEAPLLQINTSTFPKELLNFLYDKNTEANTFQFIFRAKKRM
jgi:2-polyprenyl-3-methyl-5-hydroxy-6-metoxy-1,4-benzoquinol methylase